MRWALAAVELWLLIWFVLVGLEAWLQRATVGAKSPFNLLEFHHAWVGAALVAFGWQLASVTGVLLALLGVVLTVDDFVQHVVQTHTDDRDYRSPLHELFAATLWEVRGIPTLVRVLDRYWYAAIAAAAVAVVLAGCAPARPLVPLVPRPDTRRIAGFVFDTAAMHATLDILRAAFPREASVCLYGELRDTTIALAPLTVVRIRAARQAAADSASEVAVWLTREPRSGCAGAQLIGHAHSHPGAVWPIVCMQSPDDAGVIFADLRLLFSISFCADGRRETMYQDGRRYLDRWLEVRAP